MRSSSFPAGSLTVLRVRAERSSARDILCALGEQTLLHAIAVLLELLILVVMLGKEDLQSGKDVVSEWMSLGLGERLSRPDLTSYHSAIGLLKTRYELCLLLL